MAHAEIASLAPEAALRRPGGSPATQRPFGFVLVKLASRCNINCTYCYRFRDAQVYEKPAVLTLEAEDAIAFVSRSTFANSICRFSCWFFMAASRCCFLSAGLTLCRKSYAT